MLVGVTDEVLRVRELSVRRTRDVVATTEARMTMLQAELAESDHRVVGLSNGKQINRFCLINILCHKTRTLSPS